MTTCIPWAYAGSSQPKIYRLSKVCSVLKLSLKKTMAHDDVTWGGGEGMAQYIKKINCLATRIELTRQFQFYDPETC